MKIVWVSFFLFCTFWNIKVLGQNTSYVAQHIVTEYQYAVGYYDSVEITKCNGGIFPCVEFKGKLVPAIAHLWKKDSAFVRVIGEIPFGKVYYFIRTIYCEDRDALVEMTQKKMQKDYDFTTKLYQDSADVLSLEIIDPMKLAKHECSYYGAGGQSTYNKEMDFLDVHNMSVSIFANMFKEKLSRKIYSQVNEKIGYCFRVSGQIINSTSITVINKYLTENLVLLWHFSHLQKKVEKRANLVDERL